MALGETSALVANPGIGLTATVSPIGDPISSLRGKFGACFASDIPTGTATDTSSSSAGQGYLYLVTARYRFGEEGLEGYRSDLTAEANPSPCP